MRLSEFDYSYPKELVAFFPTEKRESSRVIALNREKGQMDHRGFVDFPRYFKEGDVLVLNDSKVLPCRLFARKKTGGRIELLLLREIKTGIWECLVSGSGTLKERTELIFSEDLTGEIVDGFGNIRRVRLMYDGSLLRILEKIGHVPLPPYIKRDDQPEIDRPRYQTVYAEKPGSVAAPTAGFHLTPEILSTLKDRGVQITYLTLHVGIGTFLPIRCEKIEEHQMHGEFYEIPAETAEVINRAKREKRAVSVVGTTTVRALESACDEKSKVRAGEGYTTKFIYPPYPFHVVDRLLTNFHQPKSTLLVLVSAFAGREFVLKAYQEAIERRYRLFSYGDCMLII